MCVSKVSNLVDMQPGQERRREIAWACMVSVEEVGARGSQGNFLLLGIASLTVCTAGKVAPWRKSEHEHEQYGDSPQLRTSS